VLSFTCEEAWRMYRPNAEPSVHLTLFPDGLEQFRDDAVAAKWETIRDVPPRRHRARWNSKRAAKNIGSSLEASPLIYVSDKAIFSTLFDVDLAEICITSNAMATNDEAPANAFRLNDVQGRRRRGRKSRRHQNARVRGRSCPISARIPNTPTSRRAMRARLREWKALGVAV